MEQNISGIRQRRDWLFNAKNFLKLIAAGHRSASNKKEETATEFPVDDKDRPGDFENLIEFFVKQS